MAWSNSTPTSASKIRDLPAILVSNWEAIEENNSGVKADALNQWVVNLIDRSTTAAPLPPTALADVGMLYCTNDGSTNELYFQDSDGTPNQIQLTNAGKLGSDATQLQAQDISFGTETATYNSNNMVAYWAVVDASGASVATSGGITVVGGATGVRTVTFSVAQSSLNYGVTGTVENTPGNPHTLNYYSKGTGGFTYMIVNQNGTGVDNPSTIVVYGQRP